MQKRSRSLSSLYNECEIPTPILGHTKGCVTSATPYPLHRVYEHFLHSPEMHIIYSSGNVVYSSGLLGVIDGCAATGLQSVFDFQLRCEHFFGLLSVRDASGISVINMFGWA